MDNAIQQDEIYKELRERLREELDYLREAAQMRLYGLMLQDQPGVHVPVPLPAFSSHRLLTMTWLDGRPLMQRMAEDPPQHERNAIAEALFRAWYVPFYRYGVIHGDPHLGNYQVRPDGRSICWISAPSGCSAPVSSPASSSCSRRCATTTTTRRIRPTRPGASPISRSEKMDVLNMWARFLYEPLTQDRVRRIQETDDPTFGREVAERVHAGLKRTGGVMPPREFVLMDRSAIGLGGVFLRLKAELNWSRLFHELIADFDEAELASGRRSRWPRPGCRWRVRAGRVRQIYLVPELGTC